MIEETEAASEADDSLLEVFAKCCNQLRVANLQPRHPGGEARTRRWRDRTIKQGRVKILYRSRGDVDLTVRVVHDRRLGPESESAPRYVPRLDIVGLERVKVVLEGDAFRGAQNPISLGDQTPNFLTDGLA